MVWFGGRNPFKNSLKLLVPRGAEYISRGTIFNAFESLIGEHVRNIRGISPYKTGNNWIIYFEQSYDVSSLFDKTLKIGDRCFSLISAEYELDPYRYQTFRLHWLPWLQPDELKALKRYFEHVYDNIEVISLQPEFCIEHSMKTIFNGNYRLKIRFLEVHKNNLKIKSGPIHIEEMKTLITRLGEKPKCLHCSSEDHLRRDCLVRKHKCQKCNNYGHIEDKCTTAARISSAAVDENEDLNRDDLNGQTNEEANAQVNVQVDSQVNVQVNAEVNVEVNTQNVENMETNTVNNQDQNTNVSNENNKSKTSEIKTDKTKKKEDKKKKKNEEHVKASNQTTSASNAAASTETTSATNAKASTETVSSSNASQAHKQTGKRHKTSPLGNEKKQSRYENASDESRQSYSDEEKD